MNEIRPNLRCIGGPHDGYEGLWRAGELMGEEGFPDVLWIGLCTAPGCPCKGEDLAGASSPREGSTRYLLHGCEESVADGWITGIYRDADVCDEEISRAEIQLARVVDA